jgi:quercetin dioxygenase-like cupin family protein
VTNEPGLSGTGQTPYSPSPRPDFRSPTAIPYASVTRHVWGDQDSGEVTDWIYASTSRIHALVFGLAPGASFKHSPSYRTVFGADEVLQVLSGTMVLANPETGEVYRVATGDRVAFGPDTWHHAFAHGGTPLRVLELFAPPPATGSSGPYSRTRPYLEEARYVTDAVARGRLADAAASRTISVIRSPDLVWRRDLGVLVGIVASTPQLTAASLEVNPGETSLLHAHAGDEVVYVTSGRLWVRALDEAGSHVFELSPDDACFLPARCAHEYRNPTGELAVATIGVAPRFDP